MISVVSCGESTLKGVLSVAGLSTDSKPTDKIGKYIIMNGSSFVEMDTGKVFMFSEDNHTWYEI